MLLTSLQVSGVIGAPLAGWLTTVTLAGFAGWQVLFLVEAVPAIVFGVILVFWMADRPRDARWLSPEEKDILEAQYEAERAGQSSVRRYTVVAALRDPEVLKLCLTYFLWITGFWGFSYWTPTLLKEVSGLVERGDRARDCRLMLVSLLVSVYTGHSSSKRAEKRWHGALHMFLAAIGMTGFAFAREPWLFLAFMTLAAVGTYAPMSVWWAYPDDVPVGHGRGGRGRDHQLDGQPWRLRRPVHDRLGPPDDGLVRLAMLYLAASLTAAGVLILTLPKKRPSR